MEILTFVLIDTVFTAFTALVFALLTMLLGMTFQSFEISGPDNWKFFDFYKRYLIVAAVFTSVTLPLGIGLLGIGALALAYKFVFDAGWTQAIVMGIGGGIIAVVLFSALLMSVLAPLGLLGY